MKSKNLVFIRKSTRLLLGVLVVLVLFAGCSAGTPNADRIKSDLNASDIVGTKEFFGKNDPQMIPVTKVSVVDKSVEDDECEIKCNVVFEDNSYKIESQVTVFYSKFDAWSFEKYEIGEFSIIPISGVPNSIVKQRAEALILSSVGSIVEDAYVTNVTHDFDKKAKTDYITFDLSAKGYVSKMNLKVSAKYSFDDCWRAENFGGEVIEYEWLYDDLVGTTWSGLVGIGATRTITFNSVDTAKQTMNISYYSSTDDCSYEITDYNGFEAIKVNLPNESFTDQMWIFVNGSIRYGKPGALGGMLGKRVDNKTKMDVIIDGAEDTPDSYDASQSISDNGNSFPIIPIAITVIVAIIIIAVIAKKASKKSVSPVDVIPKKESKKIPPVDLTPPTPDEKDIIPSSDEKSGDWFKSAGDLE